MSGYIISIQVFENGAMSKWGNLAMSVSGGEPTADQLFKEILKGAAERFECDEKSVHIVGVFKI